MRTGTGTNKYQFGGKIATLALAVLAITVMIYRTIHPVHGPVPILLISSAIVFFTFVICLMLVQLFCLPMRVTVDTDSNFMEIDFLAGKTLFLSPDDISSYSQTKISTRSEGYEGWLLNTTDGRKILLSEFNLSTIAAITDFLKNSNVSFAGTEKFRFLAYYRQALTT